MSLVIPPGFASAAWVFTGPVGTQPFVTTCGVDISAFGGDFAAAADACMKAYKGALLVITSNQLYLDHVTLSVGSDGPGGSVDSTEAGANGTVSATPGPIAMAAIGRKVTNVLGRRGRGRMFLPGSCTEAGVDPDGSLTTAHRNSINTALAGFQTALETGLAGTTPVFPPVLLHSAGGPAPTPVTGFACSDLVGWIRGRIR